MRLNLWKFQKKMGHWQWVSEPPSNSAHFFLKSQFVWASRSSSLSSVKNWKAEKKDANCNYNCYFWLPPRYPPQVAKYERVINVPNCMSYLPELIPLMLDLMNQRCAPQKWALWSPIVHSLCWDRNVQCFLASHFPAPPPLHFSVPPPAWRCPPPLICPSLVGSGCSLSSFSSLVSGLARWYLVRTDFWPKCP
jgi:hypothetical protein